MRGTPQASVFTRLPRGIFALIGLVSVAAVGGALLAQYGFDIKPCPWCVLQRLIFLVIALVCLIGWLWRARASCTVSALGVLVLSACGVAAAVFQHVVAANQESCVLTLADRIITVLQLETTFPTLFQVTATCMEAASYRLLGLPFEVWSGALFVLFTLAALLILLRRAAR
ncbi:MAG TPA: disulfide bond formation protein B [Burkholderiaceae bacterium]|jgi:disulfide bond formation protein DsbB|nr:disulfide bond formation protein B [Burkholderiaceae bacterium]